jgi:hypothetical protein
MLVKEIQKAKKEVFIKGRCFVCLETKNMNPEAYCHYECAIAKSEKNSEVVKQITEKEKNG